MSVCRCNEWVLCEPNFFVCRCNEWVLCEPNFFYLDLFESMHVFFLMAFKCARGLGITVKLSFIFFVTCDLIYFWHLKHNACVVCEIDSSYDFILIFLYPPQTLFVGGILFSRCPSVRPSVRPSVTLCFLNILKSHCLIFIKPCKHVHICMTNTLDKKVRARDQFYQSYFPL